MSLAANRVSFSRVDVARDPYVFATPKGLDLGCVTDPEWGTRVVAAVVPAAGASMDLGGLREAVAAAGLARTWAPRQLLTVEALPLLASGKVDRERLRRLAAETLPSQTP